MDRVIPSTAGQTFPIEVLTGAEVDRLLGAFSRTSASGIRNRALIGLMYRCGLRLQEALDLEVRDLNLENQTITVRRGKGGKQRTVAVDHGAIALLDTWLHRRRQAGMNGSGLVFAQITKGKVGEPLDPSYVRHAIKRAGRKAGIDKRVHPHGLRHTHASELAGEGVPLHVIAAQVGHSSVATTDRYIRKIAPTELVQVIASRPEWKPGQ